MRKRPVFWLTVYYVSLFRTSTTVIYHVKVGVLTLLNHCPLWSFSPPVVGRRRQTYILCIWFVTDMTNRPTFHVYYATGCRPKWTQIKCNDLEPTQARKLMCRRRWTHKAARRRWIIVGCHCEAGLFTVQRCSNARMQFLPRDAMQCQCQSSVYIAHHRKSL